MGVGSNSSTGHAAESQGELVKHSHAALGGEAWAETGILLWELGLPFKQASPVLLSLSVMQTAPCRAWSKLMVLLASTGRAGKTSQVFRKCNPLQL